MGFLDNSGDIILDAVLTDLGRKRLAEGNFNITKFSLGDDEIDYGLYDKNHPSGSAYYDLEILQSPVLEAFTNNMSSMKSRLISYTSNDLLYLPIIELNTTVSPLESTSGAYIVPVDLETYNALTTNGTLALADGFLDGNEPLGSTGGNAVRADQGLDTAELSPRDTVNPILLETQYFIQFDNRFGTVCSPEQQLEPVTIDDDNIATYIITLDGDNGGAVRQIGVDASDSSITGPRGTFVTLKLAASLNLKTSNFLFNQLGSSPSVALAGPTTLATGDYKFIDTTLRISGVTTGYTLDVPIRLVKKM
jgi:hypothetical protein